MNGEGGTISNAEMTGNTISSETSVNYGGGAIYLHNNRTLTLENCNISGNAAYYFDAGHSGSDIRLGTNTTLKLYDNISVGVVNQTSANTAGTRTINILKTLTGAMTWIPYNNTVTVGDKVVTFDEGASAANILVGTKTSATEIETGVYVLDSEGKIAAVQLMTAQK